MRRRRRIDLFLFSYLGAKFTNRNSKAIKEKKILKLKN